MWDILYICLLHYIILDNQVTWGTTITEIEFKRALFDKGFITWSILIQSFAEEFVFHIEYEIFESLLQWFKSIQYFSMVLLVIWYSTKLFAKLSFQLPLSKTSERHLRGSWIILSRAEQKTWVWIESWVLFGRCHKLTTLIIWSPLIGAENKIYFLDYIYQNWEQQPL